MKLSGWIFMILSWTMILGMAIFCFSRIFKKGLGGDDAETLKRLKKWGEGMSEKILQYLAVLLLAIVFSLSIAFINSKPNIHKHPDFIIH